MSYKICFVCTGNACRSPFAECVMKKQLADAGIDGFEVYSLGTLNWGENPRDATMVAVAKELGKKVYRINYADLESKYVGDTPKNIRSVFATAAKDKAVLIFDEADSFLGKRLSSVTQSADYGVNIARSVMLMELEKYDGVVVFTTNLLENYSVHN